MIKISLKPKYVYFYETDDALDDILKHRPFSYDKPIEMRKNRAEALFEYEHFTLKCYKGIRPNMRAIKAWQVLVEDILYDNLNKENEIMLKMMMIPYDTLGGRIVKVNKYIS